MITTKEKPVLSLGTANFGMTYGLGNSGEQPGLSQAKQIIATAIKEGFSHLDTATAYGNSEQILGDLLPEKHDICITTKLRANECNDAKSIIQAVKDSLQRSKQTKFWSVLLHDPDILINGKHNEIKEGLNQIIEAGLTKHVGISAYSEKEIVQAKAIAPILSVFQIPENICDRRYAQSSNLSALAEAGDKIFVRSIFLQGLLLMDPLTLPRKVKDSSSVLLDLKSFCGEKKVSILELCINYACSIKWASGLIFGAVSEQQILEITNCLNTGAKIDYFNAPRLNDWLLDPRNWS